MAEKKNRLTELFSQETPEKAQEMLKENGVGDLLQATRFY